MPRLVSIASACIASTFLTVAAQAGTLITDHFTRVSPGESITAPFTAPNGVNSTASYSGPVEVLVSGTGFSLFTTINDAFYFNGGSPTTDFYQLGIGTSAEPLAPFTPQRAGRRLISFIDGVGFVSPNTVPAYNPNHDYHFVIDLGALSTQLGFGVLDGNYSDNGGQYDVTVWQLRPADIGGIPEPGTWALMILGFGAVGFAARRARLTVRFA